ncbi:tRNA epoxyqueuosine(34) reductase QueG [Roseimarinus sediminis]|uniref:tRNA epoxyqueuosine(34) reductase QueG n=1 Tax=Roseimarinus sediminis TaxID=1610899 RepID=UPI003D1C2F1B
MSMAAKYSDLIKLKAKALGFSACGITKARRLDEEEARLKAFLDQAYHGKMAYLANHFEKRLDPTQLVPGAKSVVVVLLNYFPDGFQQGIDVPLISKYAYGKDYHLVIKEKLKELYNYIDTELAPVNGRMFTDSAPVLERAWAVQAGLGWIGKNGLLLNRQLGSFFFIAELILDLELEYDQAYKKEHCGSCNQCLSACPTNALVKPYVLDARKCISYLTIELKDEIPEAFRPKLMRRAFGCDICQDVCPWNQRPQSHHVKEFEPHSELLKMSKVDWQLLSKEKFNELFRYSAVKRAGYQKLKQNIKSIFDQ